MPRCFAAPLVLALFGAFLAAPVRAQATYLVTTAADVQDGACDAHCSLREAVIASNRDAMPSAVIRFAPSLAGDTLVLTRGPLDFTDPAVVDAGALGLTVQGSGTLLRVSVYDPGVEVVGLTLTGASEIAVNSWYGDVTLRRCTLTDNVFALVVDDGATAVVEASTISESLLALSLGNFGGTIHVSNSTVTRNRVGVGEIPPSFLGEVTASNSLIAGNVTDCEVGPLGSALVSNGSNVLGTGCPTAATDVVVAPEDVFTRVLDSLLADPGGPTRTYALLERADNPAVDLGGTCGPADQRGAPAPLDGSDPDAEATCDAGAVEQGATPPHIAATPDGPPVVIPAEGGAFGFAVTLTSQQTSGPPQRWDVWGTVTAPDGIVEELSFGPVEVALEPGATVVLPRTQQIPGSAPAGAYLYQVLVGVYPVASEEASFGFEKVAGTASEPGSGVPSAYALHTPSPNPFASRATLGYDLPTPARVRLAVYDVLGREVAGLVDGEREAGRHEAVLNAHRFASGLYVCRLTAGDFTATRAVVVAR